MLRAAEEGEQLQEAAQSLPAPGAGMGRALRTLPARRNIAGSWGRVGKIRGKNVPGRNNPNFREG